MTRTRYELRDGTSSKFWEIEIDGTTLITRYGKIGAKGSETRKQLASAEEAETAAAKLVREKTGKGYARADAASDGPAPDSAESDADTSAPSQAAKAPRKRAARAKTAEADPSGATQPIPAWKHLSERSLRSLAGKLDKIRDDSGYRCSDIVLKANGNDWNGRIPLAWHLARHRLVRADSVAFLTLLCERPDLIEADAAVDLLTRFGTKVRQDIYEIFPGVPFELETLVFHTCRRAPELVRARESEMGASVRLAIAFARGRLREPVSPEDAQAIGRQLAATQASYNALTASRAMPYVRDGALVDHVLKDTAALREIARCFVTDAEWDALFVEAVQTGDWSWIPNVADALEKLPAAELARVLASRTSFNELRHAVALLESRADAPEALLAAAIALPATNDHASAVRELFALTAAARFASSGTAVPAEVDALVTFKLAAGWSDVSIDAALPGLAAIPRDRALSIVRARLEHPYGALAGLIVLAAHWDAALFDEHLRRPGSPSERVLGRLGMDAVRAMDAAMETADASRRRTLHLGILGVLSRVAGAGAETDERWDRYVTFDSVGGEALTYWGADDTTVREGILRAVPPARRSALLLSHMQTGKLPDRSFRSIHLCDDAAVDRAIAILIERRSSFAHEGLVIGLRALGDRALAPLARHAGAAKGDAVLFGRLESALGAQQFAALERSLGIVRETEQQAMRRIAGTLNGPKTRTYVLEVDREGYEPTPGTVSRTGGRAPGLEDSEAPRDTDGDPLEHVLTLDLRDLPELARFYPTSRAVALFVPEPSSGARYDEAVLVGIAEEAATRARNEGHGERPIAVFGIDVPCEIFERSDDQGAEQLRDLVASAAGHALGEPFWIQQEEEGHGAFLFQISGGLADLNLGDGGALYVFEDGFVFQSH